MVEEPNCILSVKRYFENTFPGKPAAMSIHLVPENKKFLTKNFNINFKKQQPYSKENFLRECNCFLKHIQLFL